MDYFKIALLLVCVIALLATVEVDAGKKAGKWSTWQCCGSKQMGFLCRSRRVTTKCAHHKKGHGSGGRKCYTKQVEKKYSKILNQCGATTKMPKNSVTTQPLPSGTS